MDATDGYKTDVAVGGDARVSVIGVGGAGCNIVSKLFGRMSNVRTIAVNTDKKALSEIQADTRLYICKKVTEGLGTRGDAALGRNCAQIHEAEIMAAVRGTDLAIVVAGMGGGTGSGAAAVVADLCNRTVKEVVSFAIMPFTFESSSRRDVAIKGIKDLTLVCKRVTRFENDKALEIEGVETFDDALQMVNEAIADKIDESVDGFFNTARVIIEQAMHTDGAETKPVVHENDAEPLPAPVSY